MDAIRLLTADHDKVRALFKEAEGLGERAAARRRELFGQIDEALTVHTQVEEKIFYPAFQRKAKASAQRDEVLEAFEEHAIAKRLIKELEKLRSTDERYKAKLTVLIEAVSHHAGEEEKTMFPMARKLLSATELGALGERIEAAKRRSTSPRKPSGRKRSTARTRKD